MHRVDRSAQTGDGCECRDGGQSGKGDPHTPLFGSFARSLERSPCANNEAGEFTWCYPHDAFVG